MVFSSITFLLYFLPIALLGYFVLSFSRALQNTWLLLVSLLFYAWGEPVYVLVMIASIVFNYLCGLVVGRHPSKVALVVACIGNLGNLAFFKYSGWIVETINVILGSELIPVPKISLPIGISFYTFQALSYVIDVYKGKAKAQKNLLDLGLYIAFFPQLVAGPIVRYTTVAKQIKNRKTTFSDFSQGCCRFAEGLVKKIVLANNFAIVADHIFELNSFGNDRVAVPVMLAWVGALAYTLQLYYDFSSYSDMAIGLGKMFGFNFPENFRHPFMACSIREFMSKWHMSLTGWFTNYVYKPLGGSQDKDKDKMVRNLFIVWFLTGLWHGAAWTFIWWGLYMFLWILFENVIEIEKVEGFVVLRHVYVVLAVVLSMVIFRSDSGAQLSLYFRDLVGLAHNGFYSPMALMFLKEYWLVFAFGILLLFPVRDRILDAIDEKRCPKAVGVGYQVMYNIYMPVLLVFCLAVLAKGGYNPFIYFNF